MKVLLLTATLLLSAVALIGGCRAEAEVGDTHSNVGAAR